MATRFETAFAQSPADSLETQFGETVSYTPDGGSSKNITAIIDRESLRLIAQQDGIGAVTMAILSIQTHATTGVAAPAVKDKVTFDSLDWFVVGYQKEAARWILTVDRFAKQETSGQSHRIKRL